MDDAWDDKSVDDVKFEPSPTESFLSMPGDVYPPLFATPAATVNPLEVMTPGADDGSRKDDLAVLSALATATSSAASACDAMSDAPTPAAGEKKPAKKRKSWGQVLPEPKTNLPPRYVVVLSARPPIARRSRC